MKHIIDTLSRHDIEYGPIPHSALLEGSLYYPSAGHDGGVIKDCNTQSRELNIRSFIYCDYATGPEAYREKENDFLGYHVFGSRALKPGDLTPEGWRPVLPPNLNMNRYVQYKREWAPFAHWTVYERDADRPDSHGPERFSLIYIGGEGVATYQALYWTHRIVPAALAIIQPGTGFGLNWTDFRATNAPLSWVVRKHPVGQPGIIYYGGWCSNRCLQGQYRDFSWPQYEFANRSIKPYYSKREGEVSVWKRR